MEAGSYFLEFYINEPSSSTITANLSTKPTFTKTWTGYNGSLDYTRGVNTDTALFTAGNKSLYWSPNTTSTSVISIAFANGGSGVAYLRYGSFSSANRAVLAASGWTFDGKGFTYNKSISGTTNLSIPPMTGNVYDAMLGISGASTSFTATIIS